MATGLAGNLTDMGEHNTDRVLLPLPLTCNRCGGPFVVPMDTERLAELQEAGVSAWDIARSYSGALLSQELVCEPCTHSRAN